MRAHACGQRLEPVEDETGQAATAVLRQDEHPLDLRGVGCAQPKPAHRDRGGVQIADDEPASGWRELRRLDRRSVRTAVAGDVLPLYGVHEPLGGRAVVRLLAQVEVAHAT